jgi:hypothetical protein
MFHAVYRLIELTLLLPVTITIVEGAFLATKYDQDRVAQQDFHNGCTNFNIILIWVIICTEDYL